MSRDRYHVPHDTKYQLPTMFGIWHHLLTTCQPPVLPESLGFPPASRFLLRDFPSRKLIQLSPFVSHAILSPRQLFTRRRSVMLIK